MYLASADSVVAPTSKMSVGVGVYTGILYTDILTVVVFARSTFHIYSAGPKVSKKYSKMD